METCSTCGPNLKMAWQPVKRKNSTDDFADYSDLEHNHSAGLIMTAFPTELIDGSNLSSLPFLTWFNEAYDEEDYQLADLQLRYAANRGDWYAMVMLAEMRAEIEHDDEAWRWASRVVFLLENPKNKFVDYGPDFQRENVIADAKHMMEVCIRNGADADQELPEDVGVDANFTYCLAHGLLLLPGTPTYQCDYTVHLSRRKIG